MPYIKREDRGPIDDRIPFITAQLAGPGDLNYAITVLVQDYLVKRAGKGKDGRIGYALYNEAIGVLEAAKLEFYRRAVAPYEDEKIKENGDVY